METALYGNCHSDVCKTLSTIPHKGTHDIVVSTVRMLEKIAEVTKLTVKKCSGKVLLGDELDGMVEKYV